MTLEEWLKDSPVVGRMMPNGEYALPDVLSGAEHRTRAWDLHHLSDYVVTSVIGGSIWLVPRRGTHAEA